MSVAAMFVPAMRINLLPRSGGQALGRAVGRVVEKVAPKLKRLHPDSRLEKSKLDRLRRSSSSDMIESLKPGMPEPLRVKADGTIMNGNHRIKVLEERGGDIDALPFEPYP
jgi:hypothetical protein